MLYNYVRFDSPFEFGQSYQLTITDQSNYGNFFSQFDLLKICNGIATFFVSYTPMHTVRSDQIQIRQLNSFSDRSDRFL